ncbi:ATP-binding protein [Pseudomonas sp. P5_152]|uniref:AlbA family DNA-binding domain-containing protein n=1 Tax=Pseudomonas sp. P5_152 TaxID=3043442 RepID=UPI002A36FF06|nr:ATP-binding protein [Pseudomonas sp. P5_152]MDX9664258.1 ATP-binding protein [Pseudomonas sp. P5_152]
MNSFNPFTKSLHDLNAQDLAALKMVAEGWYIEYKQEVPNAKSIAKSVSALANSYGGWVFYGIKEESKENSVAGEFPGIEKTEVDGALQKIRQAVANLMSPACHYEARAIFGPCTEIGLSESHAIICVAAPQSIEAPHIHNQGLIYRRISDGSEPVPETDRHMIEKMFQRAKETVDRYKQWIKKDPEFSKSESEAPYLRIMITPNPWKMPRTDFSLNTDSVREALNGSEGRTSTLPFETVYSSADGVVARQSSNSDPTKAQLTWNISKDLESDVLIPLHWNSGEPDQIYHGLYGHELAKEFKDILDQSKIESATVINLNLVFNLLMGVVESQRALQDKAGWPLEFYIKIKLLNVWRTIPFLDIDYFIHHINSNGIPVCLTSDCISPPGNHPETFRFIRSNGVDDSLTNQARVYIQTFESFLPIAEAFGLPLAHMVKTELERESTDGKKEGFVWKLTQAGIRSINIINNQS